ncbi:MAG: PhzF family phenazine biosynthesis protein [Planctomycetota bacterium]
MRMFQIDAFTDQLFAGNPAAVVPLESWLSDATLQAIAAENNLAETAFLVPRDGGYEIRWLTPAIEVDLCGHATLASAHAVWTELGHQGDVLELHSPRSGALRVRRAGESRYTLDFPAVPPKPIGMVDEIASSLGGEPREMLRSAWDYVAVYESEADVRALNPDLRALREVDARGIIATAPGDEHDFVSRFFGPRSGVDEDHVTGSAHCTLAPLWAERIGKNTLRAFQASPRGGELLCAVVGDRVELTGGAVTYLRGEIMLPR